MGNFSWQQAFELIALVLTPVFAAGGAWASVKFLRQEVHELKGRVERVDTRLMNLYAYLRVPLPVHREGFEGE